MKRFFLYGKSFRNLFFACLHFTFLHSRHRLLLFFVYFQAQYLLTKKIYTKGKEPKEHCFLLRRDHFFLLRPQALNGSEGGLVVSFTS